jgi:hypothetical protein
MAIKRPTHMRTKTIGKGDPLRNGVEKALSDISRIAAQFNQRYNLGPSKTEVTAKDVRLAYQNMDPMAKLKKMDQMGVDQWDRQLDKLYGGNNESI